MSTKNPPPPAAPAPTPPPPPKLLDRLRAKCRLLGQPVALDELAERSEFAEGAVGGVAVDLATDRLTRGQLWKCTAE